MVSLDLQAYDAELSEMWWGLDGLGLPVQSVGHLALPGSYCR